ncbi:hypothetical protein BRC68_06585 [Halobacteriales archaeon QH_6_64_20]|nr:MAG: hypothetical protein BRC68_06585 [Halobacteriales archaeon QH_6_64_20]
MSSDSDRSTDREDREGEQTTGERSNANDSTADGEASGELVSDESALDRSMPDRSAPDEPAGDEPADDGPMGGESTGDQEPTVSGAVGGSGPDRSVLNRAAIRRFTEGVFDAHGGNVEERTNGRWSVTLPDALAEAVGYERATFVFDPEDRPVGSDDVVVAPGTRVFGALCALAGEPASRPSLSESVSEPELEPESGSASTADPEADDRVERPNGAAGRVGFLRLDSDVLQSHVPSVLDAADFETTIEGFSPRGSERALAFHFRAQFLSVHSYQREETYTVVVDPATRSVLPSLAARLSAHLPRLLDSGGDGHDEGYEEKRRAGDASATGRTDGDHDDHDGHGDHTENGGREADEADGSRTEGGEFDRETVLGAYSAAKREAIEAVEPTAEDLRTREETAVSERVAEIRAFYDRRRAELEEEIDAERAAIEEYSDKYDRAQTDETRLRYLRERREAEDELDTLVERVERRKGELRDEERARIAEETERHRVDVDLEVERVTELSYDRGTLSLAVTNGDTTAHPTASYVPATDECYGLECGSCGTDLPIDGAATADRPSTVDDAGATTVDPPRLCIGGHLVCGTCARSCRTCGETRCVSCLDVARTTGCPSDPTVGSESEPESGTGSRPEAGSESKVSAETEGGTEPEGTPGTEIEAFEACELCREPVCTGCIASCTACGEQVCHDHRAACGTCDAAVCLACGEPCAACGAFHCDSHLVAPVGPTDRPDPSDPSSVGVVGTRDESDEELYCEAHVASCTECGDRRPVDAMSYCGECESALCNSHRRVCEICGETYCDEHAVACDFCDDTPGGAESVTTFCENHAERCVGGDEVLCEAHSRPGVIVDGPVCENHEVACDLCGVEYAERGFENGRCPACAGLSAETPAEPPVAAIAEEFRSVRIGTTATHAVIRAERRLRRDEIVVVHRHNGKEVRRFKADFFAGLSGRA